MKIKLPKYVSFSIFAYTFSGWLFMHIIKTKTLYDWLRIPKYKNAKDAIEAWVNDFSNTDYANPNEIRTKYGSADFLGNNTLIFNIKGNHYRLIVRVRYQFKRVYIIWFGTHVEYDKLKDIENLEFKES